MFGLVVLLLNEIHRRSAYLIPITADLRIDVRAG
ncbi:hypothetical protein H4W32_001269 [Actinophytocola algeriensis]|uniref:Uncharacterized protein n=1 Tax=Actinophytocola algeriensis TaxID=1768010 RepID=A0A7W7Q1G5_9PSEU|nr:hypothetical protein [Actinophytocola algeriensis]MBE1473227.1 hypothetical protein [Actinophytocola algeriensis]